MQPGSAATGHVPVMLAEVLAALQPKPGMTVLDGTLGGGGHTRALLTAGAQVIGLDWDPLALARCASLVQEFAPRLVVRQARYEMIPDVLAALGVPAVQGILLDLGFSSDQLDDAARGLSFHTDGPLDMRLDGTVTRTAADVLNSWREEDLAQAFFTYGEEPRARVLARALVRARKQAPLQTTGELLRVIEEVYPPRPGLARAHPAGRIFQALRVVVNDELAVLERALPRAIAALAVGGKLAVISFQPLEERAVKQAFRAATADELDAVGRVVAAARFKMHKKQVPGAAEVSANPRARSAILRVLERLA